jgi:hydrogenase expression/formation protein HypC
MCIGLPCKVVELSGDEAVVELGRSRKTVFLDLVDGVKTGDYVIVHAGYAISKVDEEEARKTLELVRSIQNLEDEMY